MKEKYGNIWDMYLDYDAIIITTNGFVKRNGEAVMGRGIALEAAQRYPRLPEWVGRDLKFYGNAPTIIYVDYNPDTDYKTAIITFPVKPIVGPNGEPGWRARADLGLIEESAKAVVKIVNSHRFKNVIMPRPGCGNGRLRWEEVKPVIEPILDDRFTVVTW